jgi:hypothetical protein
MEASGDTVSSLDGAGLSILELSTPEVNGAEHTSQTHSHVHAHILRQCGGTPARPRLHAHSHSLSLSLSLSLNESTYPGHWQCTIKTWSFSRTMCSFVHRRTCSVGSSLRLGPYNFNVRNCQRGQPVNLSTLTKTKLLKTYGGTSVRQAPSTHLLSTAITTVRDMAALRQWASTTEIAVHGHHTTMRVQVASPRFRLKEMTPHCAVLIF